MILRLADFERLSRLAVLEPSDTSTVTADSAFHRVERVGAHEIIVESKFDLAVRGRAPFSWTFPVSFARDIGATLDGEPCPIAIEPGGLRARVVIPASGNHVLRLHRSVAAAADEAGSEAISLPINPMPAADVVVVPPRDGAAQGRLVGAASSSSNPIKACPAASVLPIESSSAGRARILPDLPGHRGASRGWPSGT